MNELFTIIPKLPGVRVFEFSGDVARSRELAEFCEEEGHYLEIVTFDETLYEELQNLRAKVRLIPESKERYNQRSMNFDTIFIDLDIDKLENKEQFFRKVYRMMKNAADLVIDMRGKEMESMAQLLEDLNFVAINPIETKSSRVLTAKKMHGWTKV